MGKWSDLSWRFSLRRDYSDTLPAGPKSAGVRDLNEP